MSKSQRMTKSARKRRKKEWESEVLRGSRERAEKFVTISGMEIPPVVCGEDMAEWEESEKLGFPGEFPYTRGVQATMYRGRLWTMRQFAGFGTPEDTNARFHYLLEHGINGLSTAFDMPSLMGYDADHPRSRGEVGREGVSVSTIDDMDRLFRGIDLAAVTTSMTINCSASIALAMYFAVGKRRGIDLNLMGGTIQNDILKEYIAQKEWICPPKPGVRIVCDVIEFCAKHAKKFNPVSISGYHIREAGATAVQELAFTLYDGITYVEECLRRGLDIDLFAPRLSFFFDVHNDFFEEIAKYRAARMLWAQALRDTYGAQNEASWKLRFHCQTAGCSLQDKQPEVNLIRVAYQALAGVLGGCQSLHTNSMDETLALPTEHAVTLALRTQQVLAYETGVTNTVDPLGGSYFVEALTRQMHDEARKYFERIQEVGGVINGIETGFFRREIAEAAYAYQRDIDAKRKLIVGVNAFTEAEEKPIETLVIDESVEREQVAALKSIKAKRSQEEVRRHLDAIKRAAASNTNLLPVLVEAARARVTVGEAMDAMGEVFGKYDGAAKW